MATATQVTGNRIMFDYFRFPVIRPESVNAGRLCTMFRSLGVAPEIMEDTNAVAIKIGDHKLAQLPRFVLGLGNGLCVRGLPQSAIRLEMPAARPWSSPQSKVEPSLLHRKVGANTRPR